MRQPDQLQIKIIHPALEGGGYSKMCFLMARFQNQDRFYAYTSMRDGTLSYIRQWLEQRLQTELDHYRRFRPDPIYWWTGMGTKRGRRYQRFIYESSAIRRHGDLRSLIVLKTALKRLAEGSLRPTRELETIQLHIS